MNKCSGHSIYTGTVLSLYDLFVCGFSNRFVWKCPSGNVLELYNRLLSANHLEVGTGTGYFLDRCSFPDERPRLALLDINKNCLEKSKKRIARYYPEVYHANILDPLSLDIPGFDSVAMNYILHCLPGHVEIRESVLVNIKQYLNPGGVIFGATILGRAAKKGLLASTFIKVYNCTGIFSNIDDDLDGLKQIFGRQFSEYSISLKGCVAMFEGRV